MKAASFLILAALASPLLSAPNFPYLKAGQNFTRARTALLKDGWKPISMPVGEHYEYDGIEAELIGRKFTEVDSCSNDSARCVLYYRKNVACLRLDTIGEHVRGMKVVRWTDECPVSAGTKAK